METAVQEQGPAALSNPVRLDNLLRDLLPDSPREASLIVAAAQVDMARLLSDRVAAGVDVDTAIRLGAATLGQGRPFDPSACRWVAREFALALGLEVGSPAEDEWPFDGPGTDSPGAPGPGVAAPPPRPFEPDSGPAPRPLPAWPTPPAPQTGSVAAQTAPAALVVPPGAAPGGAPSEFTPRYQAAGPGTGWGNVGGPPGAGPPPSGAPHTGPRQPHGPTTRRSLITALIVVAVLVLVLGGGAAALVLHHGSNNSASTTTTTTAPSTTPPPTSATTTATTSTTEGLGTSTTSGTIPTTTTTLVQTPPGLTAINGYLAQSAMARSDVAAATLGVEACTENPASALVQINASIAIRQGIANNLPGVDLSGVASGAALRANLISAVGHSLNADHDFVSWLHNIQTAPQGQGATPCSLYMDDASWQAGNTESVAANNDKAAFVAAWNPLATRYGLQTYPSGGF